MKERWVRNQAVLWRRSGDKIVVMSSECRDVLALDAGGGAVWDALEAPSTVSEIVTRLGEHFVGSAEQVAHDVLVLLVDLESRRLTTRIAS